MEVTCAALFACGHVRSAAIADARVWPDYVTLIAKRLIGDTVADRHRQPLLAPRPSVNKSDDAPRIAYQTLIINIRSEIQYMRGWVKNVHEIREMSHGHGKNKKTP